MEIKYVIIPYGGDIMQIYTKDIVCKAAYLIGVRKEILALVEEKIKMWKKTDHLAHAMMTQTPSEVAKLYTMTAR